MKVPIYYRDFQDLVDVDFLLSPSDIPTAVHISDNQIVFNYSIEERNLESFGESISLEIGPETGRVYKMLFDPSDRLENLTQFIEELDFESLEIDDYSERSKTNFKLSIDLLHKSINTIASKVA